MDGDYHAKSSPYIVNASNHVCSADLPFAMGTFLRETGPVGAVILSMAGDLWGIYMAKYLAGQRFAFVLAGAFAVFAITPPLVGDARAAGVDLTLPLDGNVASYAAAPTFATDIWSQTIPTRRISLPGAELESDAPLRVDFGGENFSTWVAGSYDARTVDPETNALSGLEYERTLLSGQVGYETLWSEYIVSGVFLGYSAVELEMDASDGKTDAGVLTIGGFIQTGMAGLNLDVMAKADFIDLDMVSLSAGTDESTDATSYGAQLTASYDFRITEHFEAGFYMLAHGVKSSVEGFVDGAGVDAEFIDATTGTVALGATATHRTGNLAANSPRVYLTGEVGFQDGFEENISVIDGTEIMANTNGAYGEFRLGLEFGTGHGSLTFIEGYADASEFETGAGIMAGARVSF